MKREIYCLTCLFFIPTIVLGEQCTYRTWEWDTIQRKSVNHRLVKKQKSDLLREELGKIEGCTVCEEDQIEVQLEGLPTFKICAVFKERIIHAINKAQKDGFPIFSITGYRVGKSRGPLDSLGRRTEFSNHSYGIALDFNAENNGLYDSCIQFSSTCKLLRGGAYQSDSYGAITPTTSLYQAMTTAGFKWGGEIKGTQKDFMHFSIDGM